MVGREELDRFRDKLDRELKAGLVGLVLLLTVARTGPDYGYRILRTVAETTRGRLDVKEGTAYPLLANLERAGLVSSFWGDGDAGPPRKYYQVTPLGRAALERALADRAELNAAVDLLVKDLGKKVKG